MPFCFAKSNKNHLLCKLIYELKFWNYVLRSIGFNNHSVRFVGSCGAGTELKRRRIVRFFRRCRADHGRKKNSRFSGKSYLDISHNTSGTKPGRNHADTRKAQRTNEVQAGRSGSGRPESCKHPGSSRSANKARKSRRNRIKSLPYCQLVIKHAIFSFSGLFRFV